LNESPSACTMVLSFMVIVTLRLGRYLRNATMTAASGHQSTVGSIGHCNTALSLSAGVSKPKVFLGRWFRRSAILFKYD